LRKPSPELNRQTSKISAGKQEHMTLAASGNDAGAGIAVVFIIIIGIAAYWVPTIVATIRKVPNRGSVIVVNLFLGWTLVGWVVALAMAARSQVVPVTMMAPPAAGWRADPGTQSFSPTWPLVQGPAAGHTQVPQQRSTDGYW
jgi:hypothetical protein